MYFRDNFKMILKLLDILKINRLSKKKFQKFSKILMILEINLFEFFVDFDPKKHLISNFKTRNCDTNFTIFFLLKIGNKFGKFSIDVYILTLKLIKVLRKTTEL